MYFGALNQLASTHVRCRRTVRKVSVPYLSSGLAMCSLCYLVEMIPADGTLVTGTAAVDMSMLTGEPRPADVASGDAVVGGTISTNGRLEVRTTNVGAHTQLAQMVMLAEQAQARKARVQTLVDRITTYFVPAVVVLSFLVGAAGCLAEHFSNAVSRSGICCPYHCLPLCSRSRHADGTDGRHRTRGKSRNSGERPRCA